MHAQSSLSDSPLSRAPGAAVAGRFDIDGPQRRTRSDEHAALAGTSLQARDFGSLTISAGAALGVVLTEDGGDPDAHDPVAAESSRGHGTIVAEGSALTSRTDSAGAHTPAASGSAVGPARVFHSEYPTETARMPTMIASESATGMW